MTAQHIMPLYVERLAADTAGLNALEYGAYISLLTTAWLQRDGGLPDDDKDLMRASRCRDRRDWTRAAQPVLKRFFRKADDGRWRQKRLISLKVSASITDAARGRNDDAKEIGRMPKADRQALIDDVTKAIMTGGWDGTFEAILETSAAQVRLGYSDLRCTSPHNFAQVDPRFQRKQPHNDDICRTYVGHPGTRAGAPNPDPDIRTTNKPQHPSTDAKADAAAGPQETFPWVTAFDAIGQKLFRDWDTQQRFLRAGQDYATVAGWIKAGHTIDDLKAVATDVLTRMAKAGEKPPSTMSYLTQPMVDNAARMAKASERRTARSLGPREVALSWAMGSTHGWPESLGGPPDDPSCTVDTAILEEVASLDLPGRDRERCANLKRRLGIRDRIDADFASISIARNC